LETHTDEISFFVETTGKTLEELKEIFEAPKPRKASTRRAKVVLDEHSSLLDVNDRTV